ncbi:hypothetical protein [Zavarzinia sp. CC-PAN008]|uniref:hypothetical protein n=1 Tax=Zavarzinia sp. CC-PAN008 TaxID=3243332 RepID=UPI003F747811
MNRPAPPAATTQAGLDHLARVHAGLVDDLPDPCGGRRHLLQVFAFAARTLAGRHCAAAEIYEGALGAVMISANLRRRCPLAGPQATALADHEALPFRWADPAQGLPLAIAYAAWKLDGAAAPPAALVDGIRDLIAEHIPAQALDLALTALRQHRMETWAHWLPPH